jgi:diaminohydroxyphosphoribosylaminopyrimidine deaminase/5-amino-6-(5-phosphoribosylamino)uracil reductase
VQHERFMAEAIRLARKGEGAVSPNPLVGALIVEHGRIVSRGYHRRFGARHAEIDCLSHYRGTGRAATLYVNLEPCAHYGKTPPCADAIVASGIRNVVVAMRDPNPLVSGRGIRRLRRAGVRVLSGVLQERARDLNRFFVRHMVSGRPYVHLKVAESLDGKISRSGRTRWISSAHSRRLVHRWRAVYDAVLIGAGTVRADDPRLTVRTVPGRNPDVVLLDGRFRTPLGARIFRRGAKRRCFVCIGRTAAVRLRKKVVAAEAAGIIVLPFPDSRGRFRLGAVLKRLYQFRVGSVLVEGGGEIFGLFASEGPIDELSIFVAPRLTGSGKSAFDGPITHMRRDVKPRIMSCTVLGGDLLLQARFEEER